MNNWRRIRNKLRFFFRQNRFERELAEEIDFHREMIELEETRRGSTPENASAQARRQLGNTVIAHDFSREAWTIAWLDSVVKDTRYSLRTMRRNPTFTLVAVLTLALSIGATAAMFSVINGILIRPLPYPHQHRLIEIVHHAPGLGLDELFASQGIYFAYRDYSRTFESVGLWDWDSSPVTVTGSGEPEAVESVEVTHELLTILGAKPILGRTFIEADDLPGNAPTAVISYAYWQRRFGGADVLGQILVVDGIPRQLIGVLPQSFDFFEYPAEIFYPLQPERSVHFFSFSERGIALLKEGVTLAEANVDAGRIIRILIQGSPSAASFAGAQFGPRLQLLKDSIVGNLGETLWLLMATIGILLLIACGNVANLLLLRTESRRQELAIRATLGAGSAAIARVLLIESAILALAGGLVGLGLAFFSLPFLLSASATELPAIMTVKIDPYVVLFTFGTSLLAALIFAVIPVITLTGSKLLRDMSSGGRSITQARQRSRARQILVISQIALAILLLIGSGLMIRTFQALRQVDPGFREAGKIQTFQLTIPTAEIQNPEQGLRMQNEILNRLAAVAGVESAGFAAFSDGLPLDGDGRQSTVYFENRIQAAGVTPLREMQYISPNFIETLRTPLLVGRTFNWSDIYKRSQVVIISENMARAAWGSAAAAVGKRIGPSPTGPWTEVIGVIGNVHHNGLDQPPPETVSLPVPIPNPARPLTASFVIRTDRAGKADFLKDAQRAVWSVNRNLSLATVRTLGDLYQRSMVRTSITLLLLAITGAMALLLGVIGIYGVVSYAVSQRKREIGIRLTLGARQSELRRMFVKHALLLAAIGVGIGLGAAMAFTQLITSQLFGVTSMDPLTYVVVALVLVVAAMIASYLPARRASAVDPAETLKAE